MLTSDPIYNKPYKPAIYINSTSNASNYYTYDPWTDVGTTNKPIHCDIDLSENTHGKFVVQIEDGGKTLNRNNINSGARMIIKVGKQPTQMTQVFSGLIRQVGDSRGHDRKDLYNLYGSSTSIRCNERLLYFVRQAQKLVSDGITIDINDPAMKAVLLLSEAFQSTRSIQPSAIGAEGGLGIINISNMATVSSVRNFIADVNIEFGEIQDLVNLIEEQSGSEFIIDPFDIGNLRYELTRTVGGRGFTIKNKTYRISGIDDDADDTMYLIRKNWEYSKSVYKSDSYANRLSAILAADSFIPSTIADLGYTGSGGVGWYFNNDTNGDPPTLREIGVKFRPTHNRWMVGDIVLGLFVSVAIDAPPYTIPIFRIVKDSGGVPQHSNGVVANLVYYNKFNRDDHGDVVSMDYQFYDPFSNGITVFNLDTTKDYWLILSDDNAGKDPGGGSYYHTGWRKNNQGIFTDIAQRVSSSGSPSTMADGGTNWSVSNNNRPLVAFPRRRSQALISYDPKAIKNLGSGLITGGQPIESHLPSFPSIIKTKEAGYGYAANQLYYMAKPRANYKIPNVTAPNLPPMPGDPIVISDTVLGFSTTGNRVVITRCGDVHLSWGNFNGSGLTYEAPTKLSIQPVGTVAGYK